MPFNRARSLAVGRDRERSGHHAALVGDADIEHLHARFTRHAAAGKGRASGSRPSAGPDRAAPRRGWPSEGVLVEHGERHKHPGGGHGPRWGSRGGWRPGCGVGTTLAGSVHEGVAVSVAVRVGVGVRVRVAVGDGVAVGVHVPHRGWRGGAGRRWRFASGSQWATATPSVSGVGLTVGVRVGVTDGVLVAVEVAVRGQRFPAARVVAQGQLGPEADRIVSLAQ